MVVNGHLRASHIFKLARYRIPAVLGKLRREHPLVRETAPFPCQGTSLRNSIPALIASEAEFPL